ncbi:MAG: AAA family ATPase, partial [Thermomicrobiales bacterium]
MVTVELVAGAISAPGDDAVPAGGGVPAPRLTRLELQGFKSFATRTTFSFEPGITAVIGPNGSGKSNVADAIRWVLGETSQSALRGKKTEDVIFAGGTGRAPAGMAEVAVTFDNRTGWLQTPFTEVTVSRRAFRSGETQYLINGRRVRLKDVHALTASLGQSHTVVGQGLVDAALSLRAEDRRSLFEHAADLSGLRIKAVEAERSLAEADANVTRLEDLLSELGPRLRTLERSARQAREWQGVHDRLLTLQRSHYRTLLRAAKRRLAEAEAEDAAAGRRDEAGQAEAERARVAAAAARAAVEEARAALALHDVHVQDAADQARQVAHGRDLAAERHAALTRGLRDMVETRSGLDEQVEAVTAEVVAVAASLSGLTGQVEGARADVARYGDDVARIGEARAERERERDRLGRDLRDAERAATDLERRRALFDQRAETDAAEAKRARAALAERLARIAALDADLAATDRAEATDVASGTGLDRDLTAAAEAIAGLAEAEGGTREAVAAIDRRRDQAISRLEVLRRMRESGTGLYAGVRATLQAGEAGTLAGVRGALASLVEVEAPHETAIEVALGGHVQDVVVETWADAEAAIAFLKRQNAGRVTFQPLDTVRGGRAGPLPAGLLGAPGVIGVATDLVTAAPDLAAVVGGLLGRVLVVDDLPAARSSLARLPGGWSTVTLRGEIARAGGSVTGGSAARESGTLVRERDLRELPRAIAALDGEREAAAADLGRATADRQGHEAERQRLTIARAALVAARAERERERERLAKWLADLHRERQHDERRLETTQAAAAARGGERAEIASDEDRLAGEIATLGTRYEAASAGSSDDGTALVEAERALGDARQTLTALDERHRAERRREASLQARAAALTDELTVRRERLARVEGELEAVTSQLERLAAEAERVDRARETAVAGRAPLEARFRQAQRDAERAGQVAEAARTAAQEGAAARGAVALLTERARGEVATVEQRI